MSLVRPFWRAVMKASTQAMRKNVPIAKMRAAMSASGGGVLRPPSAASITPVDAGGVPAHWVSAPGTSDAGVMLYVHGGGFILGYSVLYDRFLYYLSRATGMRILGIEYRLAPEYPFPAPVDDCVTAYHWLRGQGYDPKQIVIGGDSAGGSLTFATLITLRDAGEPMPAAAVGISPATDSTLSGESMKTRAHVEVVLSLASITTCADAYGGTTDRHDPRLSPLFADHTGLPPILIHVGDAEMLLSDSLRFADRARSSGVAVTLKIWPKLWHVFQLLTPWLPEARQSVQEIGDFIKTHSEIHQGRRQPIAPTPGIEA